MCPVSNMFYAVTAPTAAVGTAAISACVANNAVSWTAVSPAGTAAASY